MQWNFPKCAEQRRNNFTWRLNSPNCAGMQYYTKQLQKYKQHIISMSYVISIIIIIARSFPYFWKRDFTNVAHRLLVLIIITHEIHTELVYNLILILWILCPYAFSTILVKFRDNEGKDCCILLKCPTSSSSKTSYTFNMNKFSTFLKYWSIFMSKYNLNVLLVSWFDIWEHRNTHFSPSFRLLVAGLLTLENRGPATR